MAEVLANSLRFHVHRLPGGDVSRTAGTTAVFLHGLVVDNLSSFYATLAVPAARAGHDVVLYDLRGHGRTERPPTGYDIGTAVQDLTALLAALGLDERSVHLIGNSYGGTIALHTALARPDLVAGLVLVEAPLNGPWIENMLDTLSVAALALEGSEVPQELSSLGARKAARLTATADELLNRTTLIDDIAASRPFMPADFARVRCPVLAVCGEHSELVPGARELARHAPNCTVRIIPGLGHDVLQGGTEELRHAVLGRLAEAARPRSEGADTSEGSDRSDRTGRAPAVVV
ncbi:MULTISPECIES: alpha/beta fold hydrolase [unclassified Streptomyces]|uniref:alpha/beta fold hydrolase n=1 Tax=unclassified Streptomyces TaxID=2593676 RepID=UPI002DDB7358|nr:alpha/beta fold hydrolase [Streptomyces sp. NBC_01750]WSB04525.1 alpha/beta hydrolase [Streptomyces sp. NBC_01794]WSD31193.1 alpha/beta hydrolase [Streptomyces sp. NBC_01750]